MRLLLRERVLEYRSYNTNGRRPYQVSTALSQLFQNDGLLADRAVLQDSLNYSASIRMTGKLLDLALEGDDDELYPTTQKL